ncbi:ATP-binding protein [Halomicroarcula sp. GCM10025324]|uniref:ATP-binding protein n=1 Tax=Haloarcula TaxID=2237 RepID=UPI0023E7578C|nr:ATP-binding protein [Halomicroarcula sp. ZS-22-S1]
MSTDSMAFLEESVDVFHVGEHYAETVSDTIAVRGQIRQRSSVDPKLEMAVFRCRECENEKRVAQNFGSIRQPAFCEGCGKQRAPWTLQREKCEYVDYQALRLQPVPERVEEGTETIDAHLTEALARQGVESGEVVTVVATYKAIHPNGSTVGEKILDAEDVIVEESAMQEVNRDAHQDVIDLLADMHDPMDVLVDSVAPTHYGDEHIKEGLILQLVRGNSPDAEGTNHRGLVHQLLLGDPGTGKTDFGEALTALSPRGQKTSGNEGTSAAGLTAAMTKDGFDDRDLTVTAGAIPKCSGGAVFIDELDSAGSSEQNALLEAMESGKVTIEKAGERAVLNAETAMLTAANPEDGHFRENDSPIQQTKIISPLLDRFDLLWVLEERTDREEIDELAGHILDGRDVATRQARGQAVPDDLLEDVDGEVSIDALRAYLQACRDLTPTFASAAVKDALREWYVAVKTRLVAREEDEERTIPVTPRSLLDLVRLAEASAKARHSETIEMVDAERATRLKSRSFRELGLDPGPDVEVKTDDDGVLVVTSDAPTAVVTEVVEGLKFEGAGYGADPDDVVDAVVEEADGLAPDDAADLIERMEAAKTIDRTPDGRLIA